MAAGAGGGGKQALACKGPAAPGKLTPLQLRELEAVLEAGPGAWGWREQCWTLARIAELVYERFKMEYTLPGWTCCCTGSAGACRSAPDSTSHPYVARTIKLSR